MTNPNWVLSRNIIIYDELRRVLAALRATETPVLVLAGAALATTVYPNLADRPMSDIDFLVHPADLPMLDKILKPLGYQPETQRREEGHYAKETPGLTMHLDLHTALPYLTETELTDVWSRAVRTELAGERALVMAPIDAVIYAVADGAFGHGRIKTTTLADVKYLIQAAPSFPWPWLVHLVKQYQLTGLFYPALRRANQEVGAGIPEAVLCSLKPSRRSGLAPTLYRLIAGGGLNGNDDVAPILRFLTRPGRPGLLAGSFFPAPDFMSRRYDITNRWGRYAYYPIRLASHGLRLLRLAHQLCFRR